MLVYNVLFSKLTTRKQGVVLMQQIGIYEQLITPNFYWLIYKLTSMGSGKSNSRFLLSILKSGPFSVTRPVSPERFIR